jgi:hypothetical protein
MNSMWILWGAVKKEGKIKAISHPLALALPL